jgi:hypothetical protein
MLLTAQPLDLGRELLEAERLLQDDVCVRQTSISVADAAMTMTFAVACSRDGGCARSSGARTGVTPERARAPDGER